MTDKQKEAIERLNLHKELAQINNDCCIVNVKDVETALNLIQEQQKDINIYKKTIEDTLKIIEDNEMKDKIIDEMAEEISKSIVNTCPFADYNVDLDCENKCKDDYKACWKQYFEYKVEEDK